MSKKIAFACDHAGFEMKNKLVTYLKEKGFLIKDFGTFSDESCDYPDYAHPMAESVENGESDFGISLCGSGNGINMVVNKHQGIRSAYCWSEEIAEMAIKHNNANVCAIPARYIDIETAKRIIDVFFESEFEGGRHQRRIDKIPVK